MSGELLTAEEVAELLRVRPSTIRLWSRQGRIPCKRLSDKVVRFIKDEVISALQSANERGTDQ